VNTSYNLLNRSVCYEPRDGKWGIFNSKTREWDGILGELARNESDVAIANYVFTEKRAGYFDYTYPILQQRYESHPRTKLLLSC